MGNVVDRFTPAEPGPRVVFAFLLTVVPVFLTLFGATVVANAYANYEALHSAPGLTLVVLALVTLVCTHVSHVLLRDVAARARSDSARSVPDSADSARVDRLRARYAAGEVTDEEFDRLVETVRDREDGVSTDRVRE